MSLYTGAIGSRQEYSSLEKIDESKDRAFEPARVPASALSHRTGKAAAQALASARRKSFSGKIPSHVEVHSPGGRGVGRGRGGSRSSTGDEGALTGRRRNSLPGSGIDGARSPLYNDKVDDLIHRLKKTGISGKSASGTAFKSGAVASQSRLKRGERLRQSSIGKDAHKVPSHTASRGIAAEKSATSLELSPPWASSSGNSLQLIPEEDEAVLHGSKSEPIDRSISFSDSGDALEILHHGSLLLKVHKTALRTLCNLAVKASSSGEAAASSVVILDDSSRLELYKACERDLCGIIASEQDQIGKLLTTKIARVHDLEFAEDQAVLISSKTNALLPKIRLHVHGEKPPKYDLYVLDPSAKVIPETKIKMFSVFLKLSGSPVLAGEEPSRVVSITPSTTMGNLIGVDNDEKKIYSRFVETLDTEARIAMKVKDVPNSMNVWRVQDLITGKLSYMMTYCEMGDLIEFVEAMPQQVSDELCVSFAFQIVQALCGFYEKGIVHSDVKPENIFVKNMGSDSFPKLISILSDFDLSIRAKSEVPLRGTASYMPPEALKVMFCTGESRIIADSSWDAWSLGVVLLWLTFADLGSDYCNNFCGKFEEARELLVEKNLLGKELDEKETVSFEAMKSSTTTAEMLRTIYDEIEEMRLQLDEKNKKVEASYKGLLLLIDTTRDSIAKKWMPERDAIIKVLLGFLEVDSLRRMKFSEALPLLKKHLALYRDEVPVMFSLVKGGDIREADVVATPFDDLLADKK